MAKKAKAKDRPASDSGAAAMEVVGTGLQDCRWRVVRQSDSRSRTRGLETRVCCGVLESGCAGAGEERMDPGRFLCRCPAWSWTLLTSSRLLRPAAATSKNRSGAMVVESRRPLALLTSPGPLLGLGLMLTHGYCNMGYPVTCHVPWQIYRCWGFLVLLIGTDVCTDNY